MSQPIPRTSAGLAEAMFDEFDDLRAGTSTPQNARAKAGIANAICTLTRLEMEHARFIAEVRKGAGPERLPELSMGRIKDDKTEE